MIFECYSLDKFNRNVGIYRFLYENVVDMVLENDLEIIDRLKQKCDYCFYQKSNKNKFYQQLLLEFLLSK